MPEIVKDAVTAAGGVLLGLDGRRDKFVRLRATTDDPRSGGFESDVGDLCLFVSGTNSDLLMRRGVDSDDWESMSDNAAVPTHVYNALGQGISPQSSDTSNRTALNALITTVNAAGGGTIYFPAGVYQFASDVSNDTIVMTTVSNIRFLGEGPGSRLLWNGEFAGAGHFFRVRRGCRNITFESLYMAAGTGAKTDSAEQHHLIALQQDPGSPLIKNNESIRVLNCTFGYTRGDAINVGGGVGQAHCHGNILATAASGAVAGPFTSPTEPQRVTVNYPATWDGGSFTISGTDKNGLAISELIPAGDGIVHTGFLEFATVTGATKSAQGVQAVNATIGFAYLTRDVWVERSKFDGFDVSGGAPQTNGYRSAVGCQRYSVNIWVQRNTMTGCGDQLIDFEATGAGGVGPWFIDHNVIVNANPQSGQGPAKTAISFFGNNETRDRNTKSRISHNVLFGVIVGGKNERIDIINNVIVPTENAASAGGIYMDGTMMDVLIAGNRIIGNSTCTNDPINLSVNNAVGGDGIRIFNNTIEHYGTRGIYVEGARDVDISNNRVINLAAASATGKGILVAANEVNSIPVTRCRIHNNTLVGNRGGGTLEYGIEIQPGSQSNSGFSICDNEIIGAATRGISLVAGTYGTPVVRGNNLSGTTAIHLGTAVVIVTGGNPGTWVFYHGPAADPNTLAGLDSAVRGSLYSSHDGASVYRKNAAGASGWVTI